MYIPPSVIPLVLREILHTSPLLERNVCNIKSTSFSPRKQVKALKIRIFDGTYHTYDSDDEGVPTTR